MIARIWHRFTTSEKADQYERLLQNEILPGIEQSHKHGLHLLRRDLPEQDEVEFITISYFESLDEVRSFAGEDYERCVVPPKAQALLKRFDQRSQRVVPKGLRSFCSHTQGLRPGLRYAAALRLLFAAIESGM